MNRRILKKRSKLAMRALIENHGYEPKGFIICDGTDGFDIEIERAGCWPRRQVPDYRRDRTTMVTPLKGTPIWERRTCWETPEYEARAACWELDMAETNWADYASAIGEQEQSK